MTTKIAIEYRSGIVRRPSVTVPLRSDWVNAAIAWVRLNWKLLTDQSVRVVFDGKPSEPVRMIYGKLHVILRADR